MDFLASSDAHFEHLHFSRTQYIYMRFFWRVLIGGLSAGPTNSSPIIGRLDISNRLGGLGRYPTPEWGLSVELTTEQR
jgi:hypothetical protein